MYGAPIKHCKSCGTAVEHRLPDDGDTKVRAVCPACTTVHYVNPLNVVGTIPVWGDKVLLCKRNIEPRLGKWTLPAGFMEMGETTADGAARKHAVGHVGRHRLRAFVHQRLCAEHAGV